MKTINTAKQNEKNIEQSKPVRELHEAELETVAGAKGCFHFKNSAQSWGF